MMDHMRQHDWCSMRPSSTFVLEQDLDNCVTEKILRNKFYDPLCSSDEEPVGPIDWDDILKKKKITEQNFKYIPGYHRPPPHPRLSSLTSQEHFQCIKVLCSQNPHVMAHEFVIRPVKSDTKVFEEVAEKYAKEQKEYIEWAKTVWVTSNCIRALRPKPEIETVYEAEFKMKVHSVQSYPKSYSMAAQIPIKTDNVSCEILLPKKELIEVNISALPEAEYPSAIRNKTSILQACPVPEPCTKHPCKFKLPCETAVSILPLAEINKELAQYALEKGSEFIASENSLRCILELDRSWTIPVSVCEVIQPDGSKSNVVVLGSDVPIKKDYASMRSYKAYRHLLVQAFTSLESITKAITARSENQKSSFENVDTELDTSIRNFKAQMRSQSTRELEKRTIETRSDRKALRELRSRNRCMDGQSDSDSSDDDRLLIDVAADVNSQKQARAKRERHSSGESQIVDDLFLPLHGTTPVHDPHAHSEHVDIGLYNCVCKDTDFETPPPRSYRNWKIRNASTKDEYNIIIHCSHKLREKSTEVILEPIPEYQLDIGGTLQSQSKLKALALSLMLRRNADLINVRIDAQSGDLVTIEKMNYDQFTTKYGDHKKEISNTLYTTLNQLAGLLPGDYLLQHEPSHGTNAMLHTSKCRGDVSLTLGGVESHTLESEEAKYVQTPPNLGPVLLPIHKARRQLPCSFTWNEHFIAKEPQKPSSRQKLPPRALKWPKKKRGRNKKK